MNKPDEKVLKEAMRLKGSCFEEYLRDCRMDALERLSNADGDDVKKIQGEAATLKLILTLIDGARPTLEKLASRTDMSKAF
jgi:hypothetical protein